MEPISNLVYQMPGLQWLSSIVFGRLTRLGLATALEFGNLGHVSLQNAKVPANSVSGQP